MCTKPVGGWMKHPSILPSLRSMPHNVTDIGVVYVCTDMVMQNFGFYLLFLTMAGLILGFKVKV